MTDKAKSIPIKCNVNWKQIADALYEENALLRKANMQLGIAVQNRVPEYKIESRSRSDPDMTWNDVSIEGEVAPKFRTFHEAEKEMKKLLGDCVNDDYRIVCRTVEDWYEYR